MARPHSSFQISASDRPELESWLRASNTGRGLAERARIVLLSDAGQTVAQVAEKVDVKPMTVYKWRRRYARQGVSGLQDRPRSGRPRKVRSRTAAKILNLTVHQVPRESTHWSIRLMMKYSGATEYQVRQVWKAADLKPHRLETFKISNDPQFAEKVTDVVGLYLQPPENALVLSVDEKSQVQALERTQPLLPMRPGRAARRTHDYRRHGTASLYAAFDVASGQVLGRITKRHRAVEFLAFLRQIDRATPSQLDLHLILDNASSHKTPQIRRWLAGHPRFHLHFTPTSASWLNAVENWFGQLERRALYRSSFNSVGQLRHEIRRYIQVHNQELAKPFRWTKEAASIIEKVDRARKTLN